MKPALFLHPYVASYPVLMLLGFFASWLLVRSRARFFGIDRRHLDNISLLLPLAGLFGARFFARLFYAKLPLLSALKVWEGDGLVFYGGFVFGVGTVLLYGLVRGLNLTRLCDCLAPGVALGLALGRVGCFLGGCCWGDLCVTPSLLTQLEPAVVRQVQTVSLLSADWPVKVRFPPGSEPYKQHLKLKLLPSNAPESLPVHPVQLYEAALAAALAWGLQRRYRSEARPGNASLALLAGYAIIRFATEYLRADNKPYAFGLTVSQAISLEILAFCALVLLLRRIAALYQAHALRQTAGAIFPQELRP